MPTKRCCCSCRIAEDNFDRADANPPGGSWHVVSGEWEIADGRLRSITAGVLATTVCHPAHASLGAFSADFQILNISDGKKYEIRAGNPSAGITATIEVTGVPGNGSIVATLGSVSYTYAWLDEASTTLDIKFCYAPGLHATLRTNGDAIPSGSNSIFATIITCIGSDGAPCHGTDPPLGNFSFIMGEFDNWSYDLHWIDVKKCPHCYCFCWDGQDARCVGPELYLTLVDIENCSGLDGSYLMMPMDASTADWGGKPTEVLPAHAWWVSDWIDCHTPYFRFFAVLECRFYPAATYPEWLLTLIGGDAVLNERGIQNLRFEGGQDYFTMLSHIAAVSLESSRCDPFELFFPDLLDEPSGPTGNVSTCCDTFYHSGNPNNPSDPGEYQAARIQVMVTE